MRAEPPEHSATSVQLKLAERYLLWTSSTREFDQRLLQFSIQLLDIAAQTFHDDIDHPPVRNYPLLSCCLKSGDIKIVSVRLPFFSNSAGSKCSLQKAVLVFPYFHLITASLDTQRARRLSERTGKRHMANRIVLAALKRCETVSAVLRGEKNSNDQPKKTYATLAYSSNDSTRNATTPSLLLLRNVWKLSMTFIRNSNVRRRFGQPEQRVALCAMRASRINTHLFPLDHACLCPTLASLPQPRPRRQIILPPHHVIIIQLEMVVCRFTGKMIGVILFFCCFFFSSTCPNQVKRTRPSPHTHTCYANPRGRDTDLTTLRGAFELWWKRCVACVRR